MERAALGAVVGALPAGIFALVLTQTTQLQVGGLVLLLFAGAAVGAFLASGLLRYWRRAVRFVRWRGNPGSSPLHHCPECQATRRSDAKYCWLCGAALEPVAEEPARAAVGSERRAAYQFSLATLMLTVTLVAIVLSVFRMSLGVGLALVFLTTPALVRTCIAAARRRARGQPVSPLGKVGMFAASFGIVVVVVVASIAAFFAVCLAMFA
jgi:hypothetical protein